jgi:chromate reductase, NAD(P)H dehydrogenase (quinone)
VSTTRKVAVCVGSLRKGSFNRMTAKVLATLAPAQLQLEIIEIGRLPLYNQDDDGAPPAPWVEFRAKVKAAPTRSCSLRRNTTDPFPAC